MYRKYRISAKRVDFLYSPPAPSSLVAAVVKKSQIFKVQVQMQRAEISQSPQKGSISLGQSAIRILNYHILMAMYEFKASKYLANLGALSF